MHNVIPMPQKASRSDPSLSSCNQPLPLRIGIAGLGTVGGGLLQLLQAARRPPRRARWAGRIAGRRRLGALDATRSAASSSAGIRWFDDPVALATDRRHRCVRRADRRRGRRRQGGGRGGARGRQARRHRQQGAARRARRRARRAGRGATASRSTSRRRSRAASRSSRRCARRSSATRSRRVYGILNGTCNYILTKMQTEGRAFADVLAGGAGAGLRRGRSDLRHRRLRRRAQARDPDQPRLRHRVAFDEIHVEGIQSHHAGRHRGRRRARLPHQAARRRACGPTAASRRASTRRWCRKHSAIAEVSRRHQRGRDRWRLRRQPAARRSRRRRPSRPRPRSSATSSTSRAATA